jgi:hypothetical protein
MKMANFARSFAVSEEQNSLLPLLVGKRKREGNSSHCAKEDSYISKFANLIIEERYLQKFHEKRYRPF